MCMCICICMCMYIYTHTHTSISQSASPTAIPVTLKAHAPQSAANEWIRGHARYPEGCAASGSVPSQSSA